MGFQPSMASGAMSVSFREGIFEGGWRNELNLFPGEIWRYGDTSLGVYIYTKPLKVNR